MVLSDALLSAAENGDLAAVQEWLAGGGDPDERTTLGFDSETLLHVLVGRTIAAERKRCAMVRTLLAAGATVDAVSDTVKNTPLILAAIYGRSELVEILCQAGADPNHRRRFNQPTQDDNPPDYALCFCLQHPDIVRTLLRFGADPSMRCHHLLGYPGPEAGKLNLLEEAALFKAARNFNGNEVEYRESARLLWNARMLRPRLRGIFRLRALCHRDRAARTSATPAMFAWLVGAAPPRPARLVCEYWLGAPIRRAPRASE